jgi:hypothetical protein
MKECQHGHSALSIPSQVASKDARIFATKLFRRVLTNWAQDLFLQHKKSSSIAGECDFDSDSSVRNQAA